MTFSIVWKGIHSQTHIKILETLCNQCGTLFWKIRRREHFATIFFPWYFKDFKFLDASLGSDILSKHRKSYQNVQNSFNKVEMRGLCLVLWLKWHHNSKHFISRITPTMTFIGRKKFGWNLRLVYFCKILCFSFRVKLFFTNIVVFLDIITINIHRRNQRT